MPKHDQRLSPRDIIMGEEKLDYKKVCQLPFGAYVQVHDDLDVTNTMESRRTGAQLIWGRLETCKELIDFSV